METQAKQKIPKGWKETTFNEIAEINPSESLRKGGSAKYIAMENLNSFSRKVSRFENKEFNGGMKFRNGDTLLARITPCLENGKTALVDVLENNEVGFGSTEYIVIREKEGLSESKFLYYFSISPNFRKVAIKLMTGTSGRQRVETNSLMNKKFLTPSLPEQKAIAAILSSLDDKIELLREQNKMLEATAQAIFKEWFFVMRDKLPKGWKIGKLGDLADITTGKGLDKSALKSNGLYQVLGANGEIGKTDEFLFDDDLILAGRVGTLGKIYLSKGKVWISDNVLISKPRIKESYYFVYFQLKRINFESLNRGSTQPLVTQTDLKNFEVILPEPKVLEKWYIITSSQFEKIFNNNFQIQTLSKLRDTLLPKLMRGEVRVAGFTN